MSTRILSLATDWHRGKKGKAGNPWCKSMQTIVQCFRRDSRAITHDPRVPTATLAPRCHWNAQEANGYSTPTVHLRVIPYQSISRKIRFLWLVSARTVHLRYIGIKGYQGKSRCLRYLDNTTNIYIVIIVPMVRRAFSVS